ncbi:MAG: hypothetical protein IT560_11615, partial [Alphaproteobacteria bacterium]|nr:hypothetical protein [Alphaproteobacteria bacterium]
DAPQDAARADDYGPVSVLLSADKNERDRRLVILEAPSYGIVGQTVTMRYRVEDNNSGGDSLATVLIRQDDGERPLIDTVPVN